MSIPRLNAQSLVYGIYLAFHVGLIWLPPYFPTQDGPSHIYNLVILRDLINGGTVWGEFYRHQIFVGPSMGFITAAYPLLTFFDPLVTEKIFLSMYVLLTGIAVPALCKVGGKPALPVSFLALPILFCYPVMMGFYSYILGVPLLLIALSVYWSGRNQNDWARLVILNLIGLALFWCHVLAFLLFVIALSAAALSQPIRLGPIFRRLLDVVLQTALPLAVTAWYFLPRWASGGMESTRSLHPRVLRRSAVNLLGLSMDSFSPTQYRIALFYTGLLAALVAISVYGFWKGRGVNEPARAFERWFMMFAFLTTLIYFITPDQFGVLGLIKLRLPIVIVLSLLPVIRLPRTLSMGAAATIAILAVVTICAVTNFIFIRRESEKAAQFMQGLSAPLGEKSVILTYNADCETPQRVDVIKHLASYYGVRKRYLDAGNYEAALGVFNTSFQPSFPQRPGIVEIEERPWMIEWDRYPAIEYILGWRMTQRDRDRLAGRYRIISEQQELSIWKRTPST
jgi:hypothetical protein